MDPFLRSLPSAERILKVDGSDTKAATGVAGLDDILAGGLRRGRVYLVEGNPGTGKTTIATQFLFEGAAQGERGLYITLSETEAELRESALSHGWDFAAPNEIFELVPPESLLARGEYLRLAISDTGVGMDSVMLGHAIEPFFSTKCLGRGTGLGLSTVHGLAAQLGGALHLRS